MDSLTKRCSVFFLATKDCFELTVRKCLRPPPAGSNNNSIAYICTYTNLLALRLQSTSADAHHFNCCHYISDEAYRNNIASCCILPFALGVHFRGENLFSKWKNARPKYARIAYLMSCDTYCCILCAWMLLLLLLLLIIFIVVDVGSAWHAQCRSLWQ